MRKVLLPTLLIVPILFAIPQAASAKAPTSKLVIEGGGLTKPLEVAEPRILQNSMIWSYGNDSFLDYSLVAAKKPPHGLRAYEVSLYAKLDGIEIKKMYVVRYCPNPLGQGYIYLPGDKDDWGAGNKDSIIRAGRDGKWNYASSAWEQLVKPLIATAEATDLLSQVAQHYQNLTQYQIESVEESEFKEELSRRWNKQYRTLARESETRYHFEFKAPYQWTTVIADGTTKWAAQPWRGEYTKSVAAALRPDKKEETDDRTPSEPAPDQVTIKLAQGVLNSLSKLDQHIKQAEILPSETIEVGGQRIACAVVRVVPETKSSRKYTSETTYWIDPQHKTVRKVRHVTQGELMPNEPGQQQTRNSTTLYTVAELGTPVAASLFQFNPLPNARLVETLTADAGLTGRYAPPLKLKTLDGNEMDLASFRGKPVLVDFWASWCAPCREQMPMLAQVYGELKDKGLVLIGVTKDEEPDKAREFLAKNHYEWPNAQDDKDGHTSESWAADGIPKLALVDKEGKITFYRAGYGTNEETELRAALHKIDPAFPEKGWSAPCR
jgi:cytochrome c biogenesis protein CcmG, thiol:disulfide interchange protein DsbE